MTTASVTWNAGLPTCPETNYEESFKDNVIRSEMDAGMQKTRQRYTRQQKMLSLSYLLTDSQKATFYTFFDNIKGGALPFNLPNPLGGSSIVVRMTGGLTGPSFVTKNLWRIQFQVEVLP
jgi:hypothetical protein